MSRKLFALIFACTFVFAIPAVSFADEAVEVVETEEIEIIDDDELDAEIVADETEEVVEVVGVIQAVEVAETAAPALVQRDSGDAAQPARRASPGRAQATGAETRAHVEVARVGMIAPAAPRGASAGMPVAAPIVVAPPPVRSECLDRRNPFAIWEDIEECRISHCFSSEYVLYGDDGDNPRCFKKCAIWGGVATRAWNTQEQEFGFCGSGDLIECLHGFIRVKDRTGASDVDFWRCVPIGTRYGTCDRPGQINICEFPNGRAQQICENGFWGNCVISRHCHEGFRESEPRQAVSVVRGRDQNVIYTECLRPMQPGGWGGAGTESMADIIRGIMESDTHRKETNRWRRTGFNR